MPAMVITHDNVSIRVASEHFEMIQKAQDKPAGEFNRINVPFHDVDRVVVIGRPDITTPAMQKMMKLGLPVFFLSSHGRWIGALSPDNNMNAERRIRQYKMADNAVLSLSVARKLVYAKIKNSRRVIQRLSANRNQSALDIQTVTAIRLDALAENSLAAENLEELRGFEGLAASLYFARIGDFFPENVPFKTRSRQPPRDAANALLSWTYSIVLGEIDGAVRSHGLDSCIGFLHSISHGSPSLALDLLEPFRAPVCDMLTLHLLNHKILTDESFEFNAEDGGTYLRDDAKKDFFYAYENSMTRKFTEKKGEGHTDFRKLIDDAVVSVLKALDGHSDFNFFIMP